MEEYFYKIVCVADQDPLEFLVTEDKNLGTLEQVHKYVLENIKKYIPENTKWILIPMKRMKIN